MADTGLPGEAGDERFKRLRALSIANWDMAFATAFATLVGGNFQSEFVRWLTSSDRVRAFMVAAPAILGLLQVPGSLWAERFPSYKRFVFWGALMWRVWWLPVIFLPLAPSGFPKLEVFIFCVLISATGLFLVNSVYITWLSELVPASHRGWYFSRRHAIANVVALLVGFPASLFVDALRDQGNLPEALTFVFALGVIFGGISFWFYCRMPDTLRSSVSRMSLLGHLKMLGQPLKDRPFRRLVVFLIVFVFAQMVAAPFFFYYAREVLHLSLLELQLLGGCMVAATLVSAPFWGQVSDTYGNKPVVFLSALLLGSGPLAWVFTYPGRDAWNMTVLVIGHLLAGVAWTGVIVGQGNLVLAVAKPETRGLALGVTQAITALVGGLAPLAGGEFMEHTKALFGETGRYSVLFTLNALLRLFSVAFLINIADPTSMRIREFLRHLAGVRPSGVIALRRLSAVSDTREKIEAIRALSRAGMRFAESELVNLLYHPAPDVRKEVARALGSVGGKRARDALVALLEHHPELVEEEMLEALGHIGDPQVTGALVRYLENPSSALRRASARALGLLRAREAVGELMRVIETSEDGELRRSAVQALRAIGDPQCASIIPRALHDPDPGVRVAAAETCADLHLKECLTSLRQRLEQDEIPDPEVAYAVGVVGEEGDLRAILRAAKRMRIQVAQRRALLGAARLLKVEAELYQFFLRDELEKDLAVMALARRRPDLPLASAYQLYREHQEREAVRLLAEATKDPRLHVLTEEAPQEGFWLAMALIASEK
jgi:HEAT repeat protein